MTRSAGPRGMADLEIGGPRLPLGKDLVAGHVHAHGSADTEGSSLSPRIKRRIRAKTSLVEIERKERGRSAIPGPPRLRTLVKDAAEIPISEGSIVPASTPTSGPQRAHPYTPVGNAVGSSSFEMVPSARTRAASDRGFDDSVETVPIPRANSSPSIIQDPTQISCAFVRHWADFLRLLVCVWNERNYASRIGAFFCPEIRAFTGLGVRFLRQSLVTIKYDLHPKMAVNSR